MATTRDTELTIPKLFHHGADIYPTSRVMTATAGGLVEATFAQVAERASRLAAGLAALGVGKGDRVATFAWNTQEHLEAYLAIPALGAILHTINIRLAADQIRDIVRHARDRVMIVDASLVDRLPPSLDSIERFVVLGERCDGGGVHDLPRAHGYEELLGSHAPLDHWPEPTEHDIAGLCYTSGTTGMPKAVPYSQRCVYLHSMASLAASGLGLTERDRVLPVVPMFHANAWGLPYSAWLAGADLVLPGRAPQPGTIARLIETTRVTLAAGVPTVWNDLLRHGEQQPLDLSSLRMILCGGAASSRQLMQAYEDRYGVLLMQAWGLTETGPLASIGSEPKDAGDDRWKWRGRAGRVLPGVEVRITDDDGRVLPRDDRSVGEIEVRGPWVITEYWGTDAPEKFHDGWLRTGDIGSLNERSSIRITDRSKDVIKSGGEWISSVALEDALLTHEAVAEAAVVGVADDRWQERPLACVVLRPGAETQPEALAAHLQARVAKWWVPDRWSFVPEIPRTSVGKIDKKVLRALHADGRLDVVHSAGGSHDRR